MPSNKVIKPTRRALFEFECLELRISYLKKSECTVRRNLRAPYHQR